jgi:hypothetical protein
MQHSAPPSDVNDAAIPLAAEPTEALLARILAQVPPIIRLPKPGTRCPYSQLSRTALSELVVPTARNRGKPPVLAIHHRSHRYAQRGIWLIPAENLFRYLLAPSTPPTGAIQTVTGVSTESILLDDLPRRLIAGAVEVDPEEVDLATYARRRTAPAQEPRR